MRIKWNSIHAKLLATYLGLTALGTSLLAGYLLWAFHASFMKTKQAELDTWSTALSESVADALENNDLMQVELLVKRYGAPETINLRIFGPEGRLLSTSSPEIDWQITDWLEIPGVREGLKNKRVRGFGKGVLSNDDRVFAVQPLNRNGQMIGLLRMSLTLSQFQRQFRTVISTVLGTLLLTFLLCGAISLWLARSMATPIQAMSRFAVRLGSGHLGEKLNIFGSDELGQLAIELNRMSERLASLDNERRSFLANVSHELRTPVSNVKVTLEALERGAAEDPELRTRFIRTAQDETVRLSRLIQDLLDLGRLEAGVVRLEEQPLSLQSLINRAVSAMELRVQSKGMSIQQDIPDVQIQGDPERLLQAFLNILDNAIKYSVSNSRIFVSGQVEGCKVAVQIRDQGAGISETDLPHIFEEFYTADSSRKKGGTGLGLAIARRIVVAHGGNISVHSKAPEGAVFTVFLPLTS
ncbi:HAMP domain-containing histidine kinase [Microcoleus sp. FACHB-68]|nr:HAMP domain-containing histidine kinase [Microcoleus sp. FACHB-68]